MTSGGRSTEPATAMRLNRASPDTGRAECPITTAFASGWPPSNTLARPDRECRLDRSKQEPAELVEIILGFVGPLDHLGTKDLDLPLRDAAEIFGVVVLMSELLDELDEVRIAQSARVRERVHERIEKRLSEGDPMCHPNGGVISARGPCSAEGAADRSSRGRSRV